MEECEEEEEEVFYTPAFLHVEKFTNETRRGNGKLHILAQDVKLDLRFDPSCVLSVTDLA
jgi:hypothetical protein